MYKDAEKYYKEKRVVGDYLTKESVISMMIGFAKICHSEQLTLPVVNDSYKMAVSEFGLKLDYVESKDGSKFLDVEAENGRIKLGEWCKYKDGTYKYR